MKYEIVVTAFLNFLSSVRSELHQEEQLIGRLNEFYGFDHNIFLLESSTHHYRYISTPSSNSTGNGDKYTPQTIWNLAASSGSGVEQLHAITSTNAFVIVVVEGGPQFKNLRVLLRQIVKIRDLKADIKVGVFFPDQIASVDIIENVFRLSWGVRILNIFGAFYLNAEDDTTSLPQLNVFKFNPFGTFDMINVTRCSSPRNYFPDELPNYRKHPLRMVKFYDVEANLAESSLREIVVRMVNATAWTIAVSGMSGTNFLLVHDDMALYEVSLDFTSDFVLTYPHRLSMVVMLVPHARPYSDFTAYLKNVTSGQVFGYIFIVIAATSLLLIISGYLHKKKILLFESLADVVNLLINDNATIRYRQLHPADAWIVAPLTFVGLVAVNGILSILQSFLTLPRYEPQINTIEDLYDSEIPIVAANPVWLDELTKICENLSGHGGWGDKIRLTESGEVVQSINSTKAFPLFYDTATAMLETHKRLNVKAFHIISDTYLSKYLMSFQVHKNLGFIEYLNDIIHRLQQAGLFDKWNKDDNENWIKRFLNSEAQLKASNDTEFGDTEFGNTEFGVPTLVWYGWIAGIIVFICEIIGNKFRNKLDMRVRML